MNVCFYSIPDGKYKVPEGINPVDMIDAEVIVVYGGDGTILKAFDEMATLGIHKSIPIFGINKGHVGFMANDVVEKNGDNYKLLIEGLVTLWRKEQSNSVFERRSLLKVSVDGRTWKRVLNEVTVHPTILGKLLDVGVEIGSENDGNTISMKGDGIIVSTPTGSTAYNLSAGGPILMPHMEAMVLTPLNPFTMAGRSIVLSPSAKITLTLNDPARVVIDGAEVNSTSRIDIEFCEDKMILVRANSFFDALQSKLGWHRPIK